MKFKSDIEVQAGIKDKDGQLGSAGQILTSTGSQTDWVDQSTINAGNAEHVVIYAKNTSGASISKGTPVYITGTVGATDTVQIAPADAGDSAKMPAVGLLDDTLANNAFGYVITGGFMDNITTDPIDGATPSSNDTVYVKVGGGLTLTKPTGPTGLIQNIAKVGKVSGGNSGSLIVSSILRTNDVPNLTTGKIWVGDGNTVESTVVHLDEVNGRMGIGTASPTVKLNVDASGVAAFFKSSSNQVPVSIFTDTGSISTVGFKGSTTTNEYRVRVGANGNDFIAYTSNTERLRILDNGNVGIGTTSPSHKLTIPSGTNGRVARLGNLEITTQAATYSGSSIEVTGSNSFIKYNSTLGHKFFTRVQGGGNTLEALTIVPDTGNVGIGTTSPTEKLDVGGNVKLRGTNNLTIGSTSNGGNFSLSSGIRGFNFANNNGDLVRIDANGNVGIGTTSPVSPLHISSSNNILATFESTDAISEIRIKDSSKYTRLLTVGSDFKILPNDGVEMAIFEGDTGNTLFNGGNVGIGTTSPSEKLVVQDGKILAGHTNTRGYGFHDLSNYSYTANTGRLSLVSNGIEAVSIDSSQNVGIGTTSPDTKLDIEDSNPFVTIQGNSSSYVNAGVQFISNQASAARGLGNFYYSAHNDVEWFSGLPYGSNDAFVINRNANYTIPSSQSSPPGIGASAGTLLKVNSNGAIQFNTYSGTNKTGTPTYLLGTDASGNVVKTNTVPGSGAGPYLPLAGGTMTGNTTHGDNVKSLYGAGGDLDMFHDGSNSYIENYTGDFIFTQALDDGDMIFKCDNGSGGTTPYLKLWGAISSLAVYKDMLFVNDGNGGKLKFGASQDLQIYHDGTDSIIQNYTGSIYIDNNADNQDIVFRCDNGSGGIENYMQIDGSAGRTLFNKNIRVNDNVQIQIGSSADLLLSHNGTNSYLSNYTGDFYIENAHDDGDIIFKSDDGSGGTTEYFRLDGTNTRILVSKPINLIDGVPLQLGNSQDLRIYHNGNNSYIQDAGTGSLKILAQDFDLNNAAETASMMRAIDGAQVELYYGGAKKLETTSTGVTVTGGWVTSGVSVAQANVEHTDNTKALFGNGNDLEIYHDGSNSYINETGTGSLYIKSAGAIRLQSSAGENMIYAVNDGAVNLYYNNVNRLQTTSTGANITGKGTSSATITSDGSSTLTTKGYVDGLITGATIYRGTWDPDVSLNSGYGNPNLNTVTQTSGYYYICSADGVATPNGTGNEPDSWNTGDWVIWNDDVGTSGEWQKIDNSSVLSGVGTGQTVALWQGASSVTDSETLGNSLITQSGDIITIGSSSVSQLALNSIANNDSVIYFKQVGTNKAKIGYDHSEDALAFIHGSGNFSTAGMVLDGTGVGIGTTSPTGKLDVVGSLVTTRVLTTGSLSLIGTDATASAQTVLTISTGVGNATGPNIVLSKSRSQSSGAVVANDPLGTIQFQGGNGTASVEGARIQSIAGSTWSSTNRDSDLLFWTTPSSSTTIAERMRINSEGNVGIGTYRPNEKLQVGGNIHIWDREGGTDSALYVTQASTTTTTAKINSNGDSFFNGGNVGIGTTSPGQKLHVVGDVKATDKIFVEDSSNSRLEFASSISNQARISAHKSNLGQTLPLLIQAEGIKFGTVGGGEKMRMGSSGNVGIGTTSPQSKLQVAGGIQMADDTDAASADKVGTMRYRTGTEYVEVTGAEILTNPGFDTDTTWVKGTGWTIANGKASVDNASSTALSQPSFGVTTGKIYNVRIDVSNYTSGSLQPQFGGSQVIASISANGEYNYTVTSTVTGGTFYLYGVGDCEFSIDNASVIEVEAESASYADMCMQTGSSTYEWVNIVRNTY